MKKKTKKNKSPAFQFYPDAYLSDLNVELMTLEEQGAYMRLLCHAWKNATAGTLPNNDEILAQLSRLGKEKWEQSKQKILNAFEVTDEILLHKRLLQESKKQREFKKLQKEKANKRWHPSGNAAALPGQCQGRQSRGNALQFVSLSSNLNKEREGEIPKTSVPEKFELTSERLTWLQANQIPNPQIETEKFLDYHRARASQFSDWEAAWRNWMRRSGEFQSEKNSRENSDQTSEDQIHAEPGKYDHLYE